jgi:hypothetical protein
MADAARADSTLEEIMVKSLMMMLEAGDGG